MIVLSRENFSAWCHDVRVGMAVKPLIMGIINVTPDSFYDGGRYCHLDAALIHAEKLIEQGADILDIGAESSRPYSQNVSIEEEWTRLAPLLKKLRRLTNGCLSVDTTKPEIMQRSLEEGVDIINDINAFQSPGALDVMHKTSAFLVMMHRQGNAQTMQISPDYPEGIGHEVNAFFSECLKRCDEKGIDLGRVILDPGFGFGKNDEHNLFLIKNLAIFRQFHMPILLGVSRKTTLGSLLQCIPSERLAGSIAMTAYALAEGINIIRTHDVAEIYDTRIIIEAIKSQSIMKRNNE